MARNTEDQKIDNYCTDFSRVNIDPCCLPGTCLLENYCSDRDVPGRQLFSGKDVPARVKLCSKDVPGRQL